MNNTPAKAPSPAPYLEAPEMKSIQDLGDKKAQVLAYLENMPDLEGKEKEDFKKEYLLAFDELSKKTDAEKQKNIGDVTLSIVSLRSAILGEKQDSDDEKDNTGDIEPDKLKRKLWLEKEIRGRIDDFKDDIERKLNATATTPPETPNTPSAVIEKTLWELNISADIPPIPNDYVSKNKPNMLESFIMNMLDKMGLWFIANWLKMRSMGYKSEKQMEYTQKAMNVLLSIKESPISSIIRLDDITEREFRKILSDHGDLDLSVLENVEAALLGKHAKEEKYKKYHRIYRGIEVMAHEINNTVTVDYKPVERLDKLLDSSKNTELDPDYSEDTLPPVPVEAPTLTDAEKRAEEIQKITDAKEADTNLKEAKAQLDEQTEENETKQKAQKKVEEASLKVKEFVDISKKEVEALKKETEDAIKDLESQIKIAQGDIDKATEVNSKSPTPANKANLDVATKTLNELQKKLASKQNMLTDTDHTHTTKTDLTEELMKFNNKEITAEDAVSSAQRAKRIVEAQNDILKSQGQKETEPELPPLTPNENNLVYFDGKLYQTIWNEWNPEYREMYYENGELKRSGRFSDWKVLRHEKWNLAALVTKWCRVIPYWEANDIIRGLDDAKKNLNNIWISIEPEHFAGKLRNIKID